MRTRIPFDLTEQVRAEQRRKLAARGLKGWCYGFMGGCAFMFLVVSFVYWLTR